MMRIIKSAFTMWRQKLIYYCCCGITWKQEWSDIQCLFSFEEKIIQNRYGSVVVAENRHSLNASKTVRATLSDIIQLAQPIHHWAMLLSIELIKCHVFFRKFWHVVTDAVIDNVQRAFADGIFSPLALALFQRRSILIESLTTPITLCNVFYKIIFKVLVNCIRPLLNDIISPC